jgi:phage shock protein A
MTTQQQINSLRQAVDRIEELAGKIKEALSADDPADAEQVLAELADTAAAMNEAIGNLAPEGAPPESMPPAD